MANDGNTVMAMYVSFTISPADLGTRSNDILPSGMRFGIKSWHVWQEAYEGRLCTRQTEPGPRLLRMTRPLNPSNRFFSFGGGVSKRLPRLPVDRVLPAAGA